MGHSVVSAGQLMLQLVAAHDEIFPAAGEAVVGKAPRPHQGGTGLIVLRIGNGTLSGFRYGP